MKGGRDASEFMKWQEKMKTQDLEDKLAEIERRRLVSWLGGESSTLMH